MHEFEQLDHGLQIRKKDKIYLANYAKINKCELDVLANRSPMGFLVKSSHFLGKRSENDDESLSENYSE